MSEFQEVVKEGAQEVARKAWRGTKRILLYATILATIIGIGYVWFNYYWTYSDGISAGTLVKVSKKGYIFKTYEGLLNVGGIKANQQGTVISNMWEFSVTKDEVYKALQEYQGKEVRLFYHQYRKSFPWDGDTNYFVYKVELEK